MAIPTRGPSSHLFMVRVWAEEVKDGRMEWRGKVQYVSSTGPYPGDGAVHYFREWPALIAWLQQMLPIDSNHTV